MNVQVLIQFTRYILREIFQGYKQYVYVLCILIQELFRVLENMEIETAGDENHVGLLYFDVNCIFTKLI